MEGRADSRKALKGTNQPKKEHRANGRKEASREGQPDRWNQPPKPHPQPTLAAYPHLTFLNPYPPTPTFLPDPDLHLPTHATLQIIIIRTHQSPEENLL